MEIYRCRATIAETPNYQAYLKAIGRLRDKYRGLILNGTFRDIDLVECSNPRIDYSVFTNGDKLAVVTTQSHNESIDAGFKVEGYEFVAWSDGVETATRQENNVQQNIVLTAIFRKKVLQVSYTTDGNGTIEGEASQSVEYGESAMSVTAVPDYGYEFAGWSDGVKTATRTDTAINNRISVTAVSVAVRSSA